MNLIDILLTIIIIVLFCLGLRTLFCEGMILHFVRKPFENMKSPAWNYILKPVVLCVVCFASVWGGTVFILLHGFLPVIELIICCVSSAFLIHIINDKMDW